MFGNCFQNCPYFQVWDSKGSNEKNESYKSLVKMLPANNKKYFDKEIKSYIYSLDTPTSKMILPAVEGKELALHQRYLVMNLYVPVATNWSMELGITDINGFRRRVNITTVQGKNQIKYFSFRYPFPNLERGVWLFLGIDLYSFMQAFKGPVFRSLDQISVVSSCQIRRIFTMKQWQQHQIPKAFWLSSNIPQQFQLIEYHDQNILPKINVIKTAQQQSPSLINKSHLINNSSSNVINKSQIRQQNKSQNYREDSPQKTISMEKYDRTQALISKSSVNTSSSRVMEKYKQHQDNIKKIQSEIKKITQSKIIERSPIRSSNNSNNGKKPVQLSKIEQKACKNSVKKSPLLQKSFEQQQAFAEKPHGDSSLDNFQTSHESLVQDRPQRWQKWQQDISMPQELPPPPKPQHREKLIEYKQFNKKSLQQKNRTTLTQQNSKTKIATPQQKVQLELIYDEMVGCYYHPQTQTYYELKN